MELQQAFRIALYVAIAATGLATGLATTRGDLQYLARQPGLLVRSLVATIVLAPIVALLLWRLLPIGPAAAIAIIAGALAPGLPTLPTRIGKLGGNVSFATSLMLVTSLLAFVTVPLWLAVLREYAGISVAVPSTAIARLLAMGLVAPLLGGMVIRRLAPRLASRIAGPIGALASALLPGLALVIVLVGASAILALRWEALLAMVLASVATLAIGHALGGPRRRDRAVLAISDAARFPALAALIATISFPEVRALPAVVAYAVIANLVTFGYGALARRGRSERGRAPSAARPEVAPAPA